MTGGLTVTLLEAVCAEKWGFHIRQFSVHDGANRNRQISSPWPSWLMQLGRELAEPGQYRRVVAMSLPTSEFAAIFVLLGAVTAHPPELPDLESYWEKLRLQEGQVLVRYQTSDQFRAGTLKIVEDSRHGLIPQIGGTRFALPRPRILTIRPIHERERDLYPMAVPKEVEFLETLLPGVDSTRYVCDTHWQFVHMGTMGRLEEDADTVVLRVRGMDAEGTAAEVLRTVRIGGRPGRVGLVTATDEGELHEAAGASLALFTDAQAVLHGFGEVDFPTTVIILDRRSPSYSSAVDKVIKRRSVSRDDFAIPSFARVPPCVELVAFEEDL